MMSTVMSNDNPNLFDGPVYDPALDNDRLINQIQRVWAVMRDEQWRTLDAISVACSNLRDGGGVDPPASISAQLRHLRKDRFGRHTVNKREVINCPGLWEYQVIPAGPLLDGQRGPADEAHRGVPCPACGGTGTVAPLDYGPPPDVDPTR